MAKATGNEKNLTKSSKTGRKMVNLAEREEEVVASRLAVLKDMDDRAKSFISILLDLFDTYSPTDLVVCKVGIYKFCDAIYECYVAFGMEEDVKRYDVGELSDERFFDKSDPLIEKMKETNKKLEGFNEKIINLAYDYLKKEPLKNFEVSRGEDKIFVLKINEVAICKWS